MERRKLKPEVKMYVRRIGDMRRMRKYGRAIQMCDKVMEHDPDPAFVQIILDFKGDCLYKIGRMTGQDFLVHQAKECFAMVLAEDPDDQVALKGLDRINFYYY